MIHGCDQPKSLYATSSNKLLRLTGFSTQKVNGLYRIRNERVNNRDSWISDRGMVLWYNKRNSWWMVSPESKVGTDKCYVYCYDTADDPSRVTSRWKYFDSNAVGDSKFREERFASVVKEGSNTVRRRPKIASAPAAPRGHRRTQSYGIHDDNRGYTKGELGNDYRSRTVKNGRTYSQDFAGLDLYQYPPDRRKARPDYEEVFTHRRRPSSGVRTAPSPQKSLSHSNHVRRRGRHHRRTSNNSSELTMSTLHPTTPRSLSGKHRRRSSRVGGRSPRDRGSTSTHRHLTRSHHQQDGFSRQQQQLNVAPKASSHRRRPQPPLDFSAPPDNMVSPPTSVRKGNSYPKFFRLKEYVGLKAKHEGGIFVTKYPYSSKPKPFCWPKKIRVEVGFIDDGERTPAVKWNGKWLNFNEIRDVTIGIKSRTFRRFENRIMRKAGVQPNQCLSVHSEHRTLDVVLKSSDDARAFKRYLEINLKHPSMLRME